MARLSLYLPPLAGDYSGVCSTLFGLDCLVIIVDANCCTRNYVEYDEPRWARRRKTAFSAQLRTLEAVMGDDERIISQACEAAEELAPACVAIIGSPVPAIMGMDLAGMACEVEARTGIPSLGLSTTGFETYEQGVSLALDALVARFCAGDSVSRAGEAGCGPAAGGACAPGTLEAVGGSAPVADDGAAVSEETSPRLRVNVLGLSPHDFADEADIRCVRTWLAEAGVDAAFCPDGTYTLDDVAQASVADVSLVVAWSGLAAARRLREEYGVPFVVGRPLCAEDAFALARKLRAAAGGAPGEAGDASAIGDDPCSVGNAPLSGAAVVGGASGQGTSSGAAPCSAEGDALSGAATLDAALASAASALEALLGELPVVSAIPGRPVPLLIIGEQVWSNAVRGHARQMLMASQDERPIVVASLFAMDDALMEPGDLRLPDEAALQDVARENPGLAWIGDPLLARIPELGEAPHLAVPHEALSSTLYERDRAALSGGGMLRALEGFIAELRD